MSKTKEKIYDILQGRFLIDQDASKNWLFVIFLVVLILMMISSSHRMDRKVMQVSRLNAEVKSLRAAFLDTRKTVMQMKLESSVRKEVMGLELGPTKQPPTVLIVKDEIDLDGGN